MSDKYNELTPFKLKDVLKELALTKGQKIYDTGRGNGNWMCKLPRSSFSFLQNISLQLASRDDNDLVGYIPEKKGIDKQFIKILSSYDTIESRFIRKSLNYMKKITKISQEELVYEIVISVLGCCYPFPSRIHNFVEPVLLDFYDKVVYKPKSKLLGNADIFTTEGASAAIIYTLNTLKYNNILIPNDKVGIITPIYSPYLELPELWNYDLEHVLIRSSEEYEWDIPNIEINKIKDVKAILIVNPCNPNGLGFRKDTIKRIANIIHEHNKDVILLIDNVYATFVEEYNTFLDELPRNVICIYSFSKYFGTTGWRLGTIMIKHDNILDRKLLKAQNDDIHKRYDMISTNPKRVKFIDRIFIDSRQVAESHTAGLSTPQQIMMCLLALFDIFDKNRLYQKKVHSLLLDRMNALLNPLDYTMEKTSIDTNYYIILNICDIADNLYRESLFVDYIMENKNPLDFILELAKDYSTIVLPASSFGGPLWSFRVSVANLNTEDYKQVGKNINSLIGKYYKMYMQEKEKKRKELF